MTFQLFLEYFWVLLLLIGLEGLLAADNALVLAIMVKHLEEEERRKALFYGLAGAFILRLSSLFLISFFINFWQIQAIGAIYLLFISFRYIFQRYRPPKEKPVKKEPKTSGFWMTVLKVEIADLAFAVDSILAAVALAVALPPTGLFTVGSLDGGQFLVVFVGGMIGVILMRFAANLFVKILAERPGLELSAFIIVGWVGVKLSLLVLSHQEIGLIPETFVQSWPWKLTFYVVIIAIAVIGWFASSPKEQAE